MDKIIYDSFRVSPARICFTGLLRDVMRFHGVDVDEDLLCGLSRGWFFRFGYRHKVADRDVYTCHRVTGNDIMVLEDGLFDFNLLKNNVLFFNFIVKETFTDNVTEIWEVIREALQNGLIPLVAVYLENLTYYPESLKTQQGHFVAVYGYDILEDVVYIGDVMIPTTPPNTYLGTISLQIFLESIRLRINRIKIPIGVWTVEAVDKKCMLSLQDYLNSLKAIWIQNQLQSIPYYDQGSINTGLHGVKCFYEDLKQIDSSDGIRIISENVQNLYSGIISRGGPAIARQQIKRYISMWDQLKEIKPLIEKLDMLSNQWRILANTFIRFGFTKNTDFLHTAMENLKHIMILEGDALNILHHTLPE